VTSHAIGGARDRPVTSSSLCVFIPRSDCPSIPACLVAPLPAVAPTSSISGRRRSPDNPHLYPGAPLHHVTHPRPWLCHRRQPSPLLQTAPDDIFDSDSDCASVRKKEGTRWVGLVPNARKIYRSKLC
jgi:hypothetical protein